MSDVLLKLDAPHAYPWPIRYRRMRGGVTPANGLSSPKPCMKSTRRPFQVAGISIWYTAPPSCPKSARAPRSAVNSGLASVTFSGSGRTWTGGGNGRAATLVAGDEAGALDLPDVH